MINRRRFLSSLAVAAALPGNRAWARAAGAHDHAAHGMGRSQTPQAGQEEDASGRLFRPGTVQQRARVTDYDNDEYIKNLEKGLKCSCGCNLDIYTCRTTDFTCTTSPALHREIVALHQDGATAEEIIATFVEEYGEEALMAPKPEGFNLAGYLVPGIVVTLLAGLLTWRLVRTGEQPIAAAAGDSAPEVAVDASAEELAQLERELRDLE